MKSFKFVWLISIFFICGFNFSCNQNTESDIDLPEDAVVSSDCNFSVFADESGLHITQHYSTNFVNSELYVYDCDEQSQNFGIITRGRYQKNFVYPFVTAGKTYSISIVLYDRNYNWSTRKESESLSITAKNGLGDVKLDYSGIVYDGKKTISVTDYKIKAQDETIAKDVWLCGACAWVNRDNYYLSSDNNCWEESTRSNYFCLNISLNYVPNGNSQEKLFCTYFDIRINYGGSQFFYLFNSTPACFIYGKPGEIILNDNDYYGITATSDGLLIVNDSYRYGGSQGKISVFNKYEGKSCPSLVFDSNSDFSTNRIFYEYPFVSAENSYELCFEYFPRNGSDSIKCDPVEIHSIGGKGDFSVNFSSINYDQNGENVSSLVLNDYECLPSDLSVQVNNVYGDLFINDSGKKINSSFPFNNGKIDLKKYLKLIRSNNFSVNLWMEFENNDNIFVFKLPISEDLSFKDNHLKNSELYNLNLSNKYEEINEFGTYGLDEENYLKKAYLVTYNNSQSKIEDKKFVTVNDCIICDLPKGDVVINNFRSAGYEPDYSNYKINYTKKTIDTHEATLTAIGEHCNIWYYDSKYETTKTINNMIAAGNFSYAHLAELFDSYFEIITYIFGSHVPVKQYANIIPISQNTKIDIFICEFQKAGYGENNLLGFYKGANLYTNDYYKNSNACELVYINADAIANSGYGIISTLLHEFQHLLTDINKDRYSSDYTEMMSTTCENIMQTLYETPCTDNSMIYGRIASLNGSYMSGVTNWGCYEETYFNYGVNCGFMDFLMRNYGGIELLKNICHSQFVNEEAYVQGVNSMGYNETFDSLMKKFALCIINAGLEPENAAGGYTADKYITNTMNIGSKNIKFELMPINYNKFGYYNPGIYDDSFRYNFYGDGFNKNLGPSIFSNDFTIENLMPKSFIIKYLGQYLEDITVTQPENDNYDFMIVFLD